MRQHSWWFWVLLISVTAVVFFVGSLVVLRLPKAWQPWAFGAYVAFPAISAALAFWANVGAIRSWLQGDRVATELIAEQEKTVAVLETLPKRMREETIAALSDFIDGRAAKALEITIVTEDKFIQDQQEKLRAGRVDEVIKAVQRRRVERVAEYNGLLARAYLQKGDTEFQAGHFDQADDFYGFALREAQASGEKEMVAECYFELGAAVGMQGRHQQAERYFTEAIRLKPHFHEAYSNRGLAYAHKGE